MRFSGPPVGGIHPGRLRIAELSVSVLLSNGDNTPDRLRRQRHCGELSVQVAEQRKCRQDGQPGATRRVRHQKVGPVFFAKKRKNFRSRRMKNAALLTPTPLRG
jgi:hypothetical protein